MVSRIRPDPDADRTHAAALPARPADPTPMPFAPAAPQLGALDPLVHYGWRRALVLAVRTLLVACVVLAIVWSASAPVLAATAGGVRWLSAHNDVTGRAVATVAVAFAAALALVLSWARATAPGSAVRLAGGRGTITVAAVEWELEARWLEQPQIVAARASVENRHRRGIRVAARVAVTEDARLDEALAAVAGITERFVHGGLGVDLAAAPRIELRYRELDLRAGRAHDFGAARSRRRDAGGGDAAG